MDRLQTFAIPLELVETLRTARHVTALTGAGVSAESGLPTFRDPLTGLWARYRPEDLATPAAFRRNPQLVWEWYTMRRAAAAQAEPNPAHLVLARMERLVPRFTLVTQNIDGLHHRAGSVNVVELHGNIVRTKCFDEGTVVESWEETGELPPRCPGCGGLLRPDVVWFGESLPREALAAAIQAARQCDVFLSVGTSGTVQPAASLVYHAMDRGATVVVINLDVVTEAAPRFYKFNVPAGRFLPALVEATWPTGS